MNNLNYNTMTFGEIVTQIETILDGDDRFKNFRESSIAKTIIEIFAATSDLSNYYIERLGEESYLDTAKLTSSLIALARTIGYTPSRPIPATADMKIVLTGPFPVQVAENDTFTIPANQNFKHNGLNYVNKLPYTYTFTSTDAANCMSSSYIKTLRFCDTSTAEIYENTGDFPSTSAAQNLSLVQGEFKYKYFDSASQPEKIGRPFQTYIIDDTTFSNYYGSEDISYNINEDTYTNEVGFTQVGIGSSESNSLTSANLYEINRSAFINSKTVNDGIGIYNFVPKVCLVISNPDKTVSVKFGDVNIAYIGLKSNEVLGIKYLSTVGAQANRIGVINDKMTYSESVISIGSSNINITQNVKVYLNSNIRFGADFESVDSIKLNSPGTYAARDRLVTKQDYISYIRSLTTPVDVKNAIAWAEQDELTAGTIGLFKFYNVVLYGAVGSLYNTDAQTKYPLIQKVGDDPTSAVTLYNGLTDSSYYETYYNSINNIYVQSGRAGVIKELRTQSSLADAPNTEVAYAQVNNKLSKKSSMNVQHLYTGPIFQYFYIEGDIIINKLYNPSIVKTKVNNAIYSYLSLNQEFNKPVYKSKITEIIESFTEVDNCSISFKSMDPYVYEDATSLLNFTDYQASYNTIRSLITTSDLEYLIPDVTYYSQAADLAMGIIMEAIVDYFASMALNPYIDTEFMNAIMWSDGGIYMEPNVHRNLVCDFTEKSFYNDLITVLYSSLKDCSNDDRIKGDINAFINGPYFYKLIQCLNLSCKKFFRDRMLSANGDITNFSMKNEIVILNAHLTDADNTSYPNDVRYGSGCLRYRY